MLFFILPTMKSCKGYLQKSLTFLIAFMHSFFTMLENPKSVSGGTYQMQRPFIKGTHRKNTCKTLNFHCYLLREWKIDDSFEIWKFGSSVWDNSGQKFWNHLQPFIASLKSRSSLTLKLATSWISYSFIESKSITILHFLSEKHADPKSSRLDKTSMQ